MKKVLKHKKLSDHFSAKEKEYFRHLQNGIKLSGIIIMAVSGALILLSCFSMYRAYHLGHENNISVFYLLKMWFNGIANEHFFAQYKVKMLNHVTMAFVNLALTAVLWVFYFFIDREERLLSKCWDVITKESK